jgi:hypothetical protein
MKGPADWEQTLAERKDEGRVRIGNWEARRVPEIWRRANREALVIGRRVFVGGRAGTIINFPPGGDRILVRFDGEDYDRTEECKRTTVLVAEQVP